MVVISILTLSLSNLYEALMASSILWLLSTFTVIWLFTRTSLELMLIMKRSHKLEFKRHIKKMLTMYITTKVTLFILVEAQVMQLYLGICQTFNDEGQMNDGEGDNICSLL